MLAVGWDFHRLGQADRVCVKGEMEVQVSVVLGPGIPLEETMNTRVLLPPAGFCASCSFLAVVLSLSIASLPQRFPLSHLPPLPRLSGLALRLL